MTITLIIPTLNAVRYLTQLLPALKALNPQPNEFLFIDSSSDDRTVEILTKEGYRVHVIPRKSFGHGKTRNLAASLTKADILIYLTQDVLPFNPNLISEISAAFTKREIGVAYVRQIPHDDATLPAQFSRHFNYPDNSFTRSALDIPIMGVRAFRSSNSCAAYRRSTFDSAGGFPENVPVSEDTLLAARMLLDGAHLHYIASTSVKHSHNYSFKQEFQRYFDIGVTHKVTPWYDNLAKNVDHEGRRYLFGEIRFLLGNKRPHLLLDMILRNGFRWIGYRMGRNSEKFSPEVCKKLAMSPHYWSEKG